MFIVWFNGFEINNYIISQNLKHEPAHLNNTAIVGVVELLADFSRQVS